MNKEVEFSLTLFFFRRSTRSRFLPNPLVTWLPPNIAHYVEYNTHVDSCHHVSWNKVSPTQYLEAM